jgi:hypothetical protein
MQERRLVRIGHTSVKNAFGFFWFDKTKIYVARNIKDLEEFEDRGHTKKELHPMCEIEQAYRDSSALRFISWCDTGCIVRQGARQVTFDYAIDKVVLHVR